MNTIELPALAGSNLKTTIEIPSAPTESPPAPWAWRIMTPKDGDKLVVWNTDSFVEMREAAAKFKELVAAGMVPYVCDDEGRPTGEVMTEFDPTAGIVDFRDVVWAPGSPKKLAVGG